MRIASPRPVATCALTAWILFLLLSFGATESVAQTPFEPDLKYWIFLTDKADQSITPGKTERVEISSEAASRRALRGRRPAEWLDRNISGEYVDELAAVGVEVVSKSRWLNAVSARLSKEELVTVTGLEFVRDVRPVALRQRHANVLTTRRLLPVLPPFSPPHPSRPAPSAHAVHAPNYDAPTPITPTAHPKTFDYGPSENQLAIVNAIPAIERGIDGSGVRIGFLDTEYADLRHAAFETLRSEGRLIASRNFTGADQTSGSWWHGFAVASVAVGFDEGNLIGPAHGAEVLLATTEYVPSETPQEEDFFVEGLEWLEASGADIVNSSLGYFDFDGQENDYSYDDLDGDTGVTTIAADIAVSLGVVFVASAGNSGTCGNPVDCMYYIGMPADGDSVITVGGVDPQGNRYVSSSYGPTADGRIKPDVVAQAEGVRFAYPQDNSYLHGGGTSFSSPMVAAVAAQMLQVNPSLDPMGVRDILRMTSSQAENPDNSMGWGTVDADAAIMMAASLPGTVAEDFHPTHLNIQTYPMPFSASVEFVINSPVPVGHARITVYDMLGRMIDVYYEGSLISGMNHVSLQTGALGAGVYVYSVETDRGSTFGSLVKVD